MAYNYRSFLLLILAFLLVATMAPKAHGLLCNGQNVAAIVVKGVLGSTTTGNPTPGCQPLASVPITLSCVGFAELTAAVNLNAATNCAALPSTGYLRSPVNQNSAAATQGSAAGITLVVVVSGFTYSAS